MLDVGRLEETQRVDTRYRVNQLVWYLVFALVGGVFNFALGSAVSCLNLPFYLDSIFTVVVTLHFGLFAGIVTAAVTNGLLSLTGQVLFPFICCNLATAVTTHLFVRRDWLADHAGYLWLGLALGVLNGVLGSITSFLVYDGVTEVHGIDRLVMSVLVTGRSLLTAVFWAGLMTNLMDKLLTVLAAFFLRSPVGRLVEQVVRSGKVEKR
jgi:energy-coupling factor transport system substrate-specific component